MLLYESRRNYKKPGQIEIQDLLKRVSTVRIRPGAPEEYRARYRCGAGLFWSKGRIRAVDTRVTNFPAGGVFESARGHQKIMTASREWRRFWFVGPPADSDRRHPRHSFPRGGEFSNPPGGTRGISSPVPLRCRALLVHAMSKTKRPLAGGASGRL